MIIARWTENIKWYQWIYFKLISYAWSVQFYVKLLSASQPILMNSVNCFNIIFALVRQLSRGFHSLISLSLLLILTLYTPSIRQYQHSRQTFNFARFFFSFFCCYFIYYSLASVLVALSNHDVQWLLLLVSIYFHTPRWLVGLCLRKERSHQTWHLKTIESSDMCW